MKNVIISISIVLALISCTKEPEIWNSATVEYAGDWYYQVLSKDMSEIEYDYGSHRLFTYNTASNTANEIWIDDDGDMFDMKIKASLDGTSDNFSAPRTTNENLSSVISLPEAANKADTTTSAQGDYIAYEITEAKIIENASLASSGVYTDSIYISLICYLNSVDIKSTLDEIDTTWQKFATDSIFIYQVDTTIHIVDSTSTWFDENWQKLNDTVFYQLDSSESIKHTAWDSIAKIDTSYAWEAIGDTIEITEEYVISGYRYTGYADDEH